MPPGQMEAMRDVLLRRGANDVATVWLTSMDHAAFLPLFFDGHANDPGVLALWRRLEQMASAPGGLRGTSVRSRL